MARNKKQDEELSVPRQRMSRLVRMGGLGAGIAGNMLTDGAKRLARGERPALEDLLLTPSNAMKVADQLSKLRGAAMKVGQILSMDGGEFIPPELAEILSKLRSSAHSMPPRQLRAVLNENWGRSWLAKFRYFDVKPIAAASIGQVHRAQAKDGRDLAIKIQYPGVRQSINSDVDNVATLINMTGLLPKGVDIQPLLEDAKAQLHEEADYEREGRFLSSFGNALSDDPTFVVPALHQDLTTPNVLAMSYVAGDPIEILIDAPQEERDRVVSKLFELLYRELFEFRMMQTDPNFANYLYDPETKKIGLLDFGAAREIADELSDGYRALTKAGLNDDWDEARSIATRMGLISQELAPEVEILVREILQLAIEPTCHDGPFDFGASDLAKRMSEAGMALRNDAFTHVPPAAAVFLHRKFGGTYLLAARLKARVDVGALIAPYLT